DSSLIEFLLASEDDNWMFLSLRVSTQICLILIFKEHCALLAPREAFSSAGQGCVFYAFPCGRQQLFLKFFSTV
ncbi:hypothetical protein, partial [Parashewanella curva]|uniref:hypothetical protein n=1 Tax=Parashewanella curva TaxID=2338552 RepID=UPI001A9DC117